ncbi:MAG TPA: phage holin family protein [Candidatus Xenobia bacterium]|jgi:putative membrane protein
MHHLVDWLLNALVILAVAHIVPGIQVRDFRTAMVVALVLGVLTFLLTKPLIVLGTVLLGLMTLPAVLVTFGLFLFIVYFVVKFVVMLLLLRMTATLVSGFTIYDGRALAFGAVLIALLQSLVMVVFH